MRPTLIFDGDCGFCTSSANWLAQRAGGALDIVPSQGLDDAALAAWDLSRASVATAVYFVDASGRASRGHQAIGAVLRFGRPIDRVAGRVVSVVGGPAYWLVARYRYRLPGGTPACKL